MDFSGSFLAGFMAVTILGLGIANILSSFSTYLRNDHKINTNKFLITWKLIILLALFGVFWHTQEIFQKEQIEFFQFLFIICGPIIILFSCYILDVEPEHSEEASRNYEGIANRRFFILLAILQIWEILANPIISNDLSITAWLAIPSFILFTILSIYPKYTFQKIGIVLAGIILIISFFEL